MLPYLSSLNILAKIENYSRMGDVSVIAICCVIFILISTSYIVRNRSYRIFAAMVGFIFLTAFANIGFNEMLKQDYVKDNPVIIGILYLLRVLYHTFLFNIFFCFALYTIVVSKMERLKARVYAIIGTLIFAIFVVVDIALTIGGKGFYIAPDTGEASSGFDVFMIGYAVFVAFIAVLMFRIRKLVYKKVLFGLSA